MTSSKEEEIRKLMLLHNNTLGGLQPLEEPPWHTICKRAHSNCDPSYNEDYLKEASNYENGWFEVGSSGGIFMFNVKNHEVLHSYKFSACGGQLIEEFHKEGAKIDWESRIC